MAVKKLGKSISLDEVREALDPARTISSIKYLLDLQAKALSGKWQSPFSEYIKEFGIVRDDGNKYVGTPDKLHPIFTQKIIGRDVDAYEKRLIQLYLALVTPAMESVTLYSRGLKLIEKDTQFFYPENILKKDVKSLENLLQHTLVSRNPESVARAWHEGSENLIQFFDSDPKNIFALPENKHPVKAHETVCALLREYGNKNAALLLKEYIESGVYHPGRYRKYLPIPADIHVMRFIIKSSSANPQKTAKILHNHTQGTMSKRIQQYLSEIIPYSGLDPIKIDDAIWIYAKEVCSPVSGGCTSQCPNQPHHHHLTVRYSKGKRQVIYAEGGKHERVRFKRDGRLEVSVKKGLISLDEFDEASA